ncbi:hypothetical protein Tco_0749214 [Tanacetum coccineum]|uniref:Uncharacterized protein n=1 Tax=Tanacetum coccineum TaxID=301880 RepID=A0ABQ4Z1A4_9ASTR
MTNIRAKVHLFSGSNGRASPLIFQLLLCNDHLAPVEHNVIFFSTVRFLKFPKNSFEVLKLLENSVEVLKILENKLESMKILKNKLESLKLQENQLVDGLTQFDLTPHMQSQRWTDINAGIQQHLQKLYNTNKASLKAAHWVINPETGTCDMESLANQEYPSLIHTFFVTHTVNGVFTQDEDQAIYEEMLSLQALGSNTASGVPYTDKEINALARKGDVKKLKKKNKYLTKQVNLMMKLFRSDEKFSHMLNQYESTPEFDSGSGGCEDDEMADDDDGDEDEEDEEDVNN